MRTLPSGRDETETPRPFAEGWDSAESPIAFGRVAVGGRANVHRPGGNLSDRLLEASPDSERQPRSRRQDGMKPVATYQDPAAAKRRLLKELRRLRFDADMTQKDVALALDWSASKVIRIEAGSVAISTTDLRALLQQYRVDDPAVRSDLEAMAKESRRQSSWQEYRGVTTQEAITYYGYEESASIIRQFDPILIPGLLQTEEYTRALLRDAFGVSPERIDKQVEIRTARQEILEREDPPQTFFIVNESAIRQQVGGSSVMRRQLQHLEDLSARPGVTIQVLPFSLGAHPGMLGSFILLEFPDPGDDNVLFLESRVDVVTRDDPEQTAKLLDVFLDMEKRATKPDELHGILFPTPA
jgi:transcriptional regulator with XRE-family HTH domain